MDQEYEAVAVAVAVAVVVSHCELIIIRLSVCRLNLVPLT